MSHIILIIYMFICFSNKKIFFHFFVFIARFIVIFK